MKRIITLQYNSDSLQRSFQIQGAGNEGDRSEALRLKGPPVETIKLEAEIDAWQAALPAWSVATRVSPQVTARASTSICASMMPS